MSDCLCDICKKKPAVIHIAGEGKYCLDCHNEKVLQKLGQNNTFKYAPTMSVMEKNGTLHTFRIEHMILGAIVSWDAYEIDGNYHFREISDINANGSIAAQKFFQKIVEGVCTKTLKTLTFGEAVSGISHQTITSLRDKGTIHIIEDEERDYELSFVIDGNKYTAEEVVELLSSYPGFMIQYQIHDESEPILKEDEYLVPVYITRQSLIDELEVAINIHGDRGFISYKDTMAFDEAFDQIINKLEVLYHSGNKDDAILAGREMVRALAHIETDDDWFPRPEIESICEIVDPFGSDEELEKIVQEWEDSF